MAKRNKRRDDGPTAPPEVSGKPRTDGKRTGAYFVAGLLFVLLTVATVLVVAKSAVVRGGRPGGPARPSLPLPAGAGPDTITDAPRLDVPRDVPQTAPSLPVPLDQGDTD